MKFLQQVNREKNLERRKYFEQLRQYLLSRHFCPGLCEANRGVYWSENWIFGGSHNEVVRDMILLLKNWSLITYQDEYYWPRTYTGRQIRLAILNTWCRFGGMKNKEKFVKHLTKELAKVNLSLSDMIL